VPKRDIDDILRELNSLGMKPSDVAAGKPSLPPGPSPERSAAAADELSKRPKHAIDRASDAMNAIPAVPSGQENFTNKTRVDNDPAVPVRHDLPNSQVGGSLNEIYSPEAGLTHHKHEELGELLLARGAISAEKLTAAQGIIKQTPGRKLSEVIIEQGGDEVQVQSGLAEHLGVAFERIDLAKGLDGGINGKLLQRLTSDFCRAKQVIPLRVEGSRVVIGTTRPDDPFVIDEVRQRLGCTSVKVVCVTPFDLRGALEISGSTETKQVDVSELLSEVGEGDVQVEKKSSQEVDLEKEASESPVIRYVNYIIQNAVNEGASDIHVEPAEKTLKVRYRIDGELYEMMQPPASMSAAITSRLKIMANLDISERRLPQDGRIRCTVAGRKLDLRVSTLPVGYGEKTVMRILDTRSINVKLEDLGFSDDCYVLWKKLIEAPHGIVLVTGPTGSGKTTTLYSSLRQLDKTSMNVSTVEDPIEYHLDGVVQCQTHEKIGMTFAMALRALLRQDPDVIMLGEIRDTETARVAVQAALTGHLVLSTLHTNDAPSSITRLVNIGLEPFLVGAAVNGVLAQRLIRRLCKECKHEAQASEEMQEFLSMQGLPADKLWGPKGCEKCRQTGYTGRVGIYELLVVDDQLRDIIARNPNVSELRRLCTERGMVTLRQDGITKAAKGITSLEEVLRATEANM
jgi:type IV pilus assembly protein PilB